MDNEIYSDLKTERKRLELVYSDKPEFKETLQEVLFAIDSAIENPRHITCGDYKTEADAERHFDSLVNPDYFIIEREVVGRRLFDDKPTENTMDGQRVRVDRLLIPTKKAFESGWIYGAIAVEIKKSRMAIGPVYAQILEYRQSIFRSRELFHCRIMPLVFAVFPSDHIIRDLHSMQFSQVILSCCHKKYDNLLHFGMYGSRVLDIKHDGIDVNKTWSPSVHKGHRGREK